jgi:hypothetical protein
LVLPQDRAQPFGQRCGNKRPMIIKLGVDCEMAPTQCAATDDDPIFRRFGMRPDGITMEISYPVFPKMLDKARCDRVERADGPAMHEIQ